MISCPWRCWHPPVICVLLKSKVCLEALFCMDCYRTFRFCIIFMLTEAVVYAAASLADVFCSTNKGHDIHFLLHAVPQLHCMLLVHNGQGSFQLITLCRLVNLNLQVNITLVLMHGAMDLMRCVQCGCKSCMRICAWPDMMLGQPGW